MRERYTALAEACGQSASPQFRNMATIGGNLLQQVRCWYYRGDFNCWMKGGDTCQARDGENQYHAVWNQSPCVAVHPSDPPGADRVRCATANRRTVRRACVDVAEFVQPPTAERHTMNTLQPDELILEVTLPPFAGKSAYQKVMDRAVWAYALASVAIAAEVQSGKFQNVRIVVGGVANAPVRATAAEALLEGQSASEDVLRQVGRAALGGIHPLSQNAYKVPLVRNLVQQAVRDIG